MKNMASTSPGGPPHPPCLSPTTQNGDLGDVHHSKKTQDEIEIALTYICICIYIAALHNEHPQISYSTA